MNPSFLRQPFYYFFFFLPHYGLTKGISSCGETVVKGAMHHLWRREPRQVHLLQQQQKHAHPEGFHFSRQRDTRKKRGLQLL